MISRLRFFWFQLKATLRFLTTGSCGLNCGYQTPYGFVPEADCPIHDNPNLMPPSSAIDRITLTVWQTGDHQVWGAMDAFYAQDDPGWITTIPLAEILTSAQQELQGETHAN